MLSAVLDNRLTLDISEHQVLDKLTSNTSSVIHSLRRF